MIRHSGTLLHSLQLYANTFGDIRRRAEGTSRGSTHALRPVKSTESLHDTCALCIYAVFMLQMALWLPSGGYQSRNKHMSTLHTYIPCIHTIHVRVKHQSLNRTYSGHVDWATWRTAPDGRGRTPHRRRPQWVCAPRRRAGRGAGTASPVAVVGGVKPRTSLSLSRAHRRAASAP